MFAVLILQLKYAVRWVAVFAAVLAASAGGVSAQSSTVPYCCCAFNRELGTIV